MTRPSFRLLTTAAALGDARLAPPAQLPTTFHVRVEEDGASAGPIRLCACPSTVRCSARQVAVWVSRSSAGLPALPDPPDPPG